MKRPNCRVKMAGMERSLVSASRYVTRRFIRTESFHFFSDAGLLCYAERTTQTHTGKQTRAGAL